MKQKVNINPITEHHVACDGFIEARGLVVVRAPGHGSEGTERAISEIRTR